MSDDKKIEAIRTYLGWPIDTHEQAVEVLDRIWHVVEEDA